MKQGKERGTEGRREEEKDLISNSDRTLSTSNRYTFLDRPSALLKNLELD